MYTRSARRVRRTHRHTHGYTDDAKTITPITSENWGVKSKFDPCIYLQCRLLVSCMSQTRCESWNSMLLPLLAIVVGTHTVRLGVSEVYLLYAYTIYVTAAHLHYGICVVGVIHYYYYVTIQDI